MTFSIFDKFTAICSSLKTWVFLDGFSSPLHFISLTLSSCSACFKRVPLHEDGMKVKRFQIKSKWIGSFEGSPAIREWLRYETLSLKLILQTQLPVANRPVHKSCYLILWLASLLTATHPFHLCLSLGNLEAITTWPFSVFAKELHNSEAWRGTPECPIHPWWWMTFIHDLYINLEVPYNPAF